MCGQTHWTEEEEKNDLNTECPVCENVMEEENDLNGRSKNDKMSIKPAKYQDIEERDEHMTHKNRVFLHVHVGS